jgi:hypothetical protein
LTAVRVGPGTVAAPVSLLLLAQTITPARSSRAPAPDDTLSTIVLDTPDRRHLTPQRHDQRIPTSCLARPEKHLIPGHASSFDTVQGFGTALLLVRGARLRDAVTGVVPRCRTLPAGEASRRGQGEGAYLLVALREHGHAAVELDIEARNQQSPAMVIRAANVPLVIFAVARVPAGNSSRMGGTVCIYAIGPSVLVHLPVQEPCNSLRMSVWSSVFQGPEGARLPTLVHGGRRREQCLQRNRSSRLRRAKQAGPSKLRPVRDCARRGWPLTGQCWPPV